MAAQPESLGPLHRQGRRRSEGGAAGGGAGVLDAGAVGRALRQHHPGGSGERHAGIGHSARVAPRDYLSEVGALGDNVDELVTLRPALDRIDPDACRARIERFFTYRVMTEGHLRMFRGFLASGVLPGGEPLPAGTGLARRLEQRERRAGPGAPAR